MLSTERALLLTVARIMRARLREEIFDPAGRNKEDYEAICEALRPFDPSPVLDQVVNAAGRSE